MILAITDAAALIVATSITAIGTLLGIWLKVFFNFRQENKEDHARVRDILQNVDTKLDNMHTDINFVKEDVSQVRESLTGHLTWHLTNNKQETNGGSNVALRGADDPATSEQEGSMSLRGNSANSALRRASGPN